MKKPTKKAKRRAASPRVCLEIHPNVIVAHRIADGEILFRHVNGSGSMGTENVAKLFFAGFRSARIAIKVSRFDAAGHDLA